MKYELSKEEWALVLTFRTKKALKDYGDAWLLSLSPEEKEYAEAHLSLFHLGWNNKAIKTDVDDLFSNSKDVLAGISARLHWETIKEGINTPYPTSKEWDPEEEFLAEQEQEFEVQQWEDRMGIESRTYLVSFEMEVEAYEEKEAAEAAYRILQKENSEEPQILFEVVEVGELEENEDTPRINIWVDKNGKGACR